MGVISITQRSESLGNISSTAMPHGRRDTDIGFVRHSAPKLVGHYNNQSSVSLGGIGDAIGKGIRLALAIGEREDERQADKLSKAVMFSVDRQDRDDRDCEGWKAPGKGHLEGQKRGLLLRTGEGCKELPKEAEELYDSTFLKIADSMDATDKQRALAADRLYNYRRSRQNRMLDIQSSEYRRLEKDGALGQLNQFVAAWKNGNDGVLEDIFRAQERVGILDGRTGERRKADRQELAVRLATDLATSRIGRCETGEEFDQLSAAVKGDIESFLPNQLVAELPDGKVGGETKKAIADEVDRAKRTFLAREEADRREARQAVGREFTDRELAMRDVPQEMWPAMYDAMGRDETLRKADPKRAMAYIDTANEMRTAASKAKEKASADAIKGNEENLARSLATLDLLKMEGSLSQDDANDAQAAIWRKFRALSLGKQLSPSFMRSFEGRLSGQLSDQEANAMRKFYQAFGFSADLDNGGEPTATARKDAKKDSEDYYAPLEEDGVKLESRKTRIKAADLLTYGDTLLRTLRALGPDMNREGVVEREIARLKTGWMKGEIDKNRDATVRSVMDMQRETRTRWEAEQPDKRREEDDGR